MGTGSVRHGRSNSMCFDTKHHHVLDTSMKHIRGALVHICVQSVELH